MSTRMTFDGRVAIVTGAGGGVGRAYADLLAARGAAVVVNDLGAPTAGGGADESRAQTAAREIVEAGGTAVADTSDISTEAGATHLVETALAEFGRIDILINNAGIFNVDSFPDIDVDWLQRTFDVHVKGSFLVTRAAWPTMAEAGYGRIVFTTSASALGADDTVGYGAAKMGVFGLARSVAHVAEPLGIRVNLVAPMAMTRMMSTGMGLGDEFPEVPERAPSLAAPLVAYLAHESCETNGETYNSGMRRASRLSIAANDGYTHPDLDLAPEDIRDNWTAINDASRLKPVSGTMAFSEMNEAQIAATPYGDAAPLGKVEDEGN